MSSEPSTAGIASSDLEGTWIGAGLGELGRQRLSDALAYLSPGLIILEVDLSADTCTIRYRAPSTTITESATVAIRDAHEQATHADQGALGGAMVGRWERSAAEPPPETFSFVGHGAIVGGPLFARLVARLDAYLQTLSQEFDASELLPPATVSWQTLEASGYARAFPQHLLNLAAVSQTQSAVAKVQGEWQLADAANAFDLLPAALPPAACLHVYAMRRATTAHETVYSLLGTCGRYEATHDSTPTRLRTYRLRELVALGNEDFVDAFAARAHRILASVADDLELPGRIASASDSFLGPEAADRVRFQHRARVKTELLVGEPAPIAIGSLNKHGTTFGNAFEIRHGQGPASSACLGFGLERCALAVLAAHGSDESRWPQALR